MIDIAPYDPGWPHEFASVESGSDPDSREAYACAKSAFVDRIVTLALQPSSLA